MAQYRIGQAILSPEQPDLDQWALLAQANAQHRPPTRHRLCLLGNARGILRAKRPLRLRPHIR